MGIESIYKTNPLIEYYVVYVYLLASDCSSVAEFEVVPIRCRVPAILRYISPLLRVYTSVLNSSVRYLLAFIKHVHT